MASESSITQNDIKNILKGIKIPSPPQIIADLQMEMAMPDPDLNAMAEMISKDPGLAGGVLKILNSPVYGNHGCVSISKAVMMLGMNTVANIVNTVYVRGNVTPVDDTSDVLYKAMIRFWDSAIDVAQACRLVAQYLRFNEPDKMYMLGLFHNSGIPLLMQRFPDYHEIIQQSYLLKDHRIVDTENRLLKTNHAVLSYYAASSWKLPEVLCQIIADHHSAIDIFSAKNNTNIDMKYYLGILKLGEHLSAVHRTMGNNEADFEWEQISEKVVDYLGLSQLDYDDLVSYAADNGIGEMLYFM